MPKIKFLNAKKEVDVPEGTNLRKAAMDAGVDVYSGIHKKWFANCHGLGLCCQCRMYIKKGQENVSQPGIWEKIHTNTNPFGFFGKIGHEQEMRLSCQTKVYGDVEVEATPEFNWHGEKFWA